MPLQIGFTNAVQFKALEDLKGDYVDLSLSYCGMEDCEPGHVTGPSAREEYVIHIITKGKGTYQVRGKTYHLSANDAFAIFPEEMICYQADEEDPWSYCWIGFSGIKASECIANTGMSPEHPVSHVKNGKKLEAYIGQMLEARQLTYANELKRGSLMMYFLADMINEHTEAATGHMTYDYSGTVYVKHAVNYLTQNYHKKIKISELATYIGVNRSYLTNSFKQAMKVSPQEFLVNLRMEKALTLLKQTEQPINVVSAQVGYDDPLAFSKIFKKKYGISPRQFRDSIEPEAEVQQKGV